MPSIVPSSIEYSWVPCVWYQVPDTYSYQVSPGT